MKHRMLIIAVLFICNTSYAQHGSITLSYPISFPTGDLGDYIGKTSFRGVSAEFNTKVQPQITVGIESGWNTFYDRADSKEYKSGSATITGVQYRYTNTLPVIGGFKYFIKTAGGNIKPFVGAGAGTMYARRVTDFGLYEIADEAWQLCFRPEAGIKFKTNAGVQPYIGLKYYASFNGGGLDGQKYLTLNLGVSFSEF